MAEREAKIEDEYGKLQKSQQGKAKSVSQTVQQKGILSAKGGVNKRRQDYSDNVDIALAKLGAQYNINNDAAKKGDMSKELPEQGGEICGIQDGAQDLSEEDSQFARDKNLLQYGVITRDQFKKKWNSKEY